MEPEKQSPTIFGVDSGKLWAFAAAALILLALLFVYANNERQNIANQLQNSSVLPNGTQPAYFRGNPNATVEITEFFDFQCPYCSAAEGKNKQVQDYLAAKYGSYQPAVELLLEKYGNGSNSKIKLSYHDFPFIGQESFQASLAARCAGEQGKYLEYHDYLMSHQQGENQGAFGDANLAALAQSLGLDTAQWGGCFSSGKYLQDINADIQLGRTLGVTGTPAFFVNRAPVDASFSAMDSAVSAKLVK